MTPSISRGTPTRRMKCFTASPRCRRRRATSASAGSRGRSADTCRPRRTALRRARDGGSARRGVAASSESAAPDDSPITNAEPPASRSSASMSSISRSSAQGAVSPLSATPATIVDVDREVRRQERRDSPHRPEAAMAQRAVDEKQRRPLTLLLERDHGAVFRASGGHVSPSSFVPYFPVPIPSPLNRSTASFGSKSSSSNS